MKIVRVKICKRRTPSATGFSYPADWLPEKINVLAYEDHPDRLGDVVEECVAEIEDDVYATQLLADPDVTEITEGERDSFLIIWRPQYDVTVTLTTSKGKEKKADIGRQLERWGLSYLIEEV